MSADNPSTLPPCMARKELTEFGATAVVCPLPACPLAGGRRGMPIHGEAYAISYSSEENADGAVEATIELCQEIRTQENLTS